MRISHQNAIELLKEVILPKDLNILDSIEETREYMHDKDKLSVRT
jgi:hypothetical protein